MVHLSAGSIEEFRDEVGPLVAALMAMEVDPVDSKLGRVVVPESSSGRRFDFYFKPMCGRKRYRTTDLIKWWGKGSAWVENNRDHPFAYVMAGRLNNLIVDEYVRRESPVVFLRKGKQVGLLPVDSSAELEEEILGSFK